jgi:DNA repair exonuclease SbcCD ATPase subunit
MRGIQAKRSALQARVDQDAALLGPGWTAESVRRFDVSIPAAQEVADWGVRLQSRKHEMDSVSERAAGASAHSKEVEARVLELERRLGRAPRLPSMVELEQREKAIRTLRTHLFDISQAEGTLRVSREKVEKLADRSCEATEAVRRVTVEIEQQENAVRSFDDLLAEHEIATGQRAVRQLRALLGEAAVEERELRHAKQRAEDANARYTEVAADASRLQADLERREAACAAVKLPPAEALAASNRALRELRGRLGELRNRQVELEAARVRLAERRGNGERPAEGRLGALGWAPLVLALVLGGAAAVFASRGELELAAGAGLLCVVLVGLWVAARPRASTDRAAVGEAEQAVSSARTRVDAASAGALKVAQHIGLERVPDELELEAKADEIVGLIAARQEHDRELTALKQLASDVSVAVGAAERAKIAQGAAEHAVDEQQRELAARRRGIADVARVLQLDGESSPASVEDKAAALDEQARRLRERGFVVARLQELRKECDRLKAEDGRLAEALEVARGEALAAETRVEEANSVARQVAGELGRESLPSSADLEAMAGDTAKQVRGRIERDRETADLEALRVESGKARELAAAAEAAAEHARLELEEVQRLWEAWKVDRGCPVTLRPETAQQFFASIHRLREQLGTIDSWDAETGVIEREIEEFAAAVTAVARVAGTDSASGRQPEDVLRALMQTVEAQDRARHERERLGRELEGAKVALEGAEREVALASDKLQALFREAGAEDEPSCRANIVLSRRRADLKRKADEAERRLRGRLGAGEAAEAVRDELTTADCQGWEAVKQECKATLSRQQPAYEDAVRKHQAELEALSVLERETDVVALGMEKEGLLAETRDAVTEWRRLAIAQTLLEATLKRYETERQPAVLTRAAATFSRITAGRYTRLASKEDGLDALAADGGRIDAGSLSRGTAEQLYLCLRLALAGEFARHQVSLPLIMDDVLVNFDPERAQSCAEVLTEVAREQQVLLFTCHPDTASLLRRLRPATRIIEIARPEPHVQLAIG